MKKTLIVMSTLALLFYGCDAKKTESADEDGREKNMAAVMEINKAIESGDVSKLDQYIAEDAVDHASPLGDINGLANIKNMLAKVHTMGTNMKMENIRTVADGEYVFQWMRETGTTANADMGMPAGSNFDINAVQVSRFKDGKVIEHWEFMQPADMAKMIGMRDTESTNAIDTVQNR